MIVQIRAPMGAGKSTLVQRLLREHNGVVVHRVATRREQGKLKYTDVWHCDGNLYVLGSYHLDSTSGTGGDPLYGPWSVEVMRHYAAFGHVLHEGARAANMKPNGTMPDLLALPDLVWAVLDTPFDECIRRIYARREERGRNIGASLNVTSQEQNFRRIHRIARDGADAGIRVVTLNDGQAYEQLQELMGQGGWRPGMHRAVRHSAT
jgi:hypothetical protein